MILALARLAARGKPLYRRSIIRIPDRPAIHLT
jgi:hypothetical protein